MANRKKEVYKPKPMTEGKTAERIAMTPVANHEVQEVDTETGSKEIESEEV